MAFNGALSSEAIPLAGYRHTRTGCRGHGQEAGRNNTQSRLEYVPVLRDREHFGSGPAATPTFSGLPTPAILMYTVSDP